MNYAHPMRYRPMEHPHFVPALTQALGALGAEQGDLFAVDWEAVKALGGVSYASALLSIAQGAQLGMPQAVIDTAINVVLLRNKAPNMFRQLFGLYPLSPTAFLAERNEMVRRSKEPPIRLPTDWNWYEKTDKAWMPARERLQANKPAKEITKAELEQIARIAGWSDKQRLDALRGDNVYKLRPTPWTTYAAVAAGLLLAWYVWRAS